MKKIENVQVLVELIDQYTDWQTEDEDFLLNLHPRWSPDAPRFLTDAFKDVVGYDVWIHGQLITYGFHLVMDYDIDESTLFRHYDFEDNLDWLKESEIRPLYVERAERDNKILSNGPSLTKCNSLSQLLDAAQRLELKDLIPKFAKVFDSLITQD